MSDITKGRILSIDAMRGVASFFVVIFHAFGNVGIFPDRLLPNTLSPSNLLYIIPAFGYAGVYLFFVISGYCIHLRWAKIKGIDESGNLQINFKEFWKRRWIRLYPAYLAAISIYLAWEWYQGTAIFNGFFAWNLISHLLMIHNLDARTTYSIAGVFWTLAIEEQLYLLYFVALALRRRFGWRTLLLITFACRPLWMVFSVLVWKAFGFELPFTQGALANWWIWILGALAVENHFGIIRLPRYCYSKAIAGALFSLAALIHYLGILYGLPNRFGILSDMLEPYLWGAGFFIVVNYFASRETAKIGSRWTYRITAVWAIVGLFSYSLYLTHEWVLEVVGKANPFVVTGLCLAFAYVFFIIFERPFITYLSNSKTAVNTVQRIQ